MKKALIAPVFFAILLLVSASAAGETEPAAVFSQERDLLENGTLAERITLGNSVFILEVAEVFPPEAQIFYERTPFDGVNEQEVLETWDYEQTAVQCRVVGSEKSDYRLYFARNMTARSSGEKAPCPDDDFPDPAPGDRLLVFDSGMRNGFSSLPPLWEGRTDQINAIVVLDGNGHATVCLAGTVLLRGSSAIPID